MSPEHLPSKIGKSVGEKLRAARIAMHYTQGQLAAPDFSVSYISAIERGQIHPSLRALEILAGRLGLSSTQLLPARSQAEEQVGAVLSATEREEDEVELALLEAQITIREGAIEQAINQLLKLASKRLKRQQQLEQRYLLGWAYLRADRYQEAEYTLSEAIQQMKDLNAHYLSTRILNLHALSHASMSNYTQALLSHQRCLNLLESSEPADPLLTAQVYMHMGQHHTQLGNLEQAVAMLHKALELTASLRTTQEIQNYYWELCCAFSETKEHGFASKYAYKCLHLSTSEKLRLWRSELYHYLGKARMKKDPEQAHIYLESALEQENLNDDSLSLASLSMRKAEWHFMQKELTEAERAGNKAKELAQSFGDTLIAAETLILLGHIAYTQSRQKEGDKHFRSGLDMLDRLGHREEVANESVRYAQILEEHGNEQEAFTYFKRAFQSRQLAHK